MRNGASDKLSRSLDLEPEEVFNLLGAQIREELYPLMGEEGIIDQCIEEEIAALQEAKFLWQNNPHEQAIALMQQSSNERVVQIGEALASGDTCGLAI